jgi:hypothetical protein
MRNRRELRFPRERQGGMGQGTGKVRETVVLLSVPLMDIACGLALLHEKYLVL